MKELGMEEQQRQELIEARRRLLGGRSEAGAPKVEISEEEKNADAIPIFKQSNEAVYEFGGFQFTVSSKGNEVDPKPHIGIWKEVSSGECKGDFSLVETIEICQEANDNVKLAEKAIQILETACNRDW